MDKTSPGIYQILNKINNKIYIGSSIDIISRFHQHKTALRHNKHHCLYLQNSWNKYGEENFEFLIIEKMESYSREEIFSKEQWYFDNWNPIYNEKREVDYIDNSEPKIHRRKLTAKKVIAMRKFFSTGNYTYSDIARKYKIHPTQARAIILNLQWKSLDTPVLNYINEEIIIQRKRIKERKRERKEQGLPYK